MYHRVTRYVQRASVIVLLIAIEIMVMKLPAQTPVPNTDAAGIPLGSWYRWLENTKPVQANSHYRLELYSFFIQEGTAKPTVRAITASIYPSAEVRTLLKLGTVQPLDDEDDNGLHLRFNQEYSALALNSGKAEGFPVATQFDISGLRRDRSQLLISIMPGSGKGTVRINGNEFRPYVDDLVAMSQGPQSPAVARDLLRLLFAHIYLIEARIPNFGGNAMMNIKQSAPALVSGSLWIEFVAKGIFGFGNSGVLFKVGEASEFPRLWVKGEIFGGAYQMGGQLSFFVRDGDKTIPVATLDASEVSVTNGITTSGHFSILFPRSQYGANTVEVPHSAVGQ